MEKQFSLRKVQIPIKLKLIVLLVTLIALSTLLYLLFAIDLFTEDKSAYLYESNLNHTESISSQIGLELKYSKEQLLTLYNAQKSNPQIAEQVFEGAGRLIEFSIYKESDAGIVQIFGLADQTLLDENELDGDYFSNLTKETPISFQMILERGEMIYRAKNDSKLPHLILSKYLSSEKVYLIGRLSIASLLDLLKKSKIYQTALFKSSGESLIPFAEPNEIDLTEIIQLKSGQGVRELNSRNGSYLVSFNVLSNLGLVAISVISKDLAYSVTDYLIKKSFFVALFIVSLAIVIGIVFSKGLTSPLEKLSEIVSTVATGDFSKRVSISSRDEIGQLSDSFNYMSEQIVDFMEKMKVKLRMENEIAVAQLVQSSFFPSNDVDEKNVFIAAYYRPATECGGDWWGYITAENRTVIIMADATGHGVPAALLTSTAYCCANNLQVMAENNPEILTSPSKILEFFNQAVASVGDRILMTAFVGVIDHQKNELKYSNASHNPPMLLTSSLPSEVTKESFKSLVDAVGPHLGKNRSAMYEEISVPIFPNDEIILYTDGLVEGQNGEGKGWGARRFLKSLTSHYESEPTLMRDSVIKEAFEFYQNIEPADDITLAIVKVKNGKII